MNDMNKCETCEKEFVKNKKNHIYCSESCRNKASRIRHSEYQKKYNSKYRGENVNKLRIQASEYRSKNKVKIQQQLHDIYHNNKEKYKSYRVSSLSECRDEIFEHYGDVCMLCGQNQRKFLCMDHLNNDGKHYRDACGGGWISSRNFLRSNNWPNEVIQILCYNCNARKQLRRYNEKCCDSTRSNRKLKQRVKRKYGGKCSLCGYDKIDILQVDHVSGGGNLERNKLGKGNVGVGSLRIYRMLSKENVREDYRLLCPNCNMNNK